MKDKIKYIVALLIAVTISVVYVPIMHIGGFKIALIDFVKIGLAGYGYEQGAFEQILMSSISSELDTYVYIITIFMIVLLFHAVMVIVLSEKVSYIYAIASGIIMNICTCLLYAGIKDAYEEVQMAIQFLGQGDYIKLGKAPVIIWVICSLAAIGLSVLGLVLTMNKPVRITGGEINPEDFYYKKNPWQNSEKELESYSEAKVKPDFYGGIKGKDGKFSDKIYLLEELVPVCFVKQGQMFFLMKQESVDNNLKNGVIDEIIGEVYYVPQYEEYVVKPSDRLKVFLASGQPLGKDREYFLPRETEIYFDETEQTFILA